MKVLKGGQYSQARLAGIMHEVWCSYMGRLPKGKEDTIYATGKIKENAGETGLVIDENSVYYDHFPDIHKGRLNNVTANDGWNDEE